MSLPTYSLSRSSLVVALVGAASFGLLYRHVLAKLIRDWSVDENYSHGFLIIPLSLYFAWERRERFVRTAARPSMVGLAIAAGSLAVLVAGTLGAELFLMRISLVGLIVGAVVFSWGWGHARTLAFPIGFLLLMIPLPSIVFNQITFPLQLLASRFGETALYSLGIPVLREGNVIVLANTTLEVAEACSGIRSLVSLLTLGIVLGYFTEPRAWMRIAIALATVPVAIATNGLRVAGTGVAAHYVGPEAATGFLHEFSGWLVFLLAFAMLVLVQRAMAMAIPLRQEPSAVARVAP